MADACRAPAWGRCYARKPSALWGGSWPGPPCPRWSQDGFSLMQTQGSLTQPAAPESPPRTPSTPGPAAAAEEAVVSPLAPSRDAGSLRVFVDHRSPYYLGLLLLITNGNKQREANGPHGKCSHSGSGTGTPPHGADELEVWPLVAKRESRRLPRPIGKNKVAH